ncbi:hypothetical protein PHISCL_09629 [Aspergillus sclerotialis]|uniref:Uncharacterized protein n=1 Tax=Aspergillus sclerotialis TaxID=2070753 RepID=A0A3A2ZJI8_9EURO|nr:hypothetical protein PHISCL_09629 [Aspergillus sclerotialis]
MHTEPLLLTLATISTVAAQLYYNDALRDPVDFWSDYGDYLARVLGDTVSVVTAGQDSTHTTYHLNCAGPSASMDAYGCIVGNGATVVRGQNIINMRTVLNGE